MAKYCLFTNSYVVALPSIAAQTALLLLSTLTYRVFDGFSSSGLSWMSTANTHAGCDSKDAFPSTTLLPLQFSYKPHGRYESTYGRKILNPKKLQLSCNDTPKDDRMFRGVLGDQHITYLAIKVEKWQDFLTELYLYSHPRLLRPLQGSCVSSLISVHQSSRGHFVLAVEPPSNRGWRTAEGRLSEQEKQCIIDAYATVHAHDTLHGSVFLQNILLDNDGRVKIIDFTQASQKAASVDEQARSLGIRDFQPCDRAFETRHVKFLLDYNGAREKEWSCTRRALLKGTIKAYSSDLKADEPFFIPKDTLHAWKAHVEECNERGVRRFKIEGLDWAAYSADDGASAPASHRAEHLFEAEQIYMQHISTALTSLASQLRPGSSAPSPTPSLPGSPSSGSWPITWLLNRTPPNDDSLIRSSAAVATAPRTIIAPPSSPHPPSPSPTEDRTSGSPPVVPIPIRTSRKRRRDQEDEEDILKHKRRRVRPKRPEKSAGTGGFTTTTQFIEPSTSTSSGLYSTDVSRPFPLAAYSSPLAYVACSDSSDSDASSSPSAKTPPADAICDTAAIASPHGTDEEHSDARSNFSVYGFSEGDEETQDDRDEKERNEDADDEDDDDDEDSLPGLTFDIVRCPSEDASSIGSQPSLLKPIEENETQSSGLQPNSVILVDRNFVGTAFRVSEDMFRCVSEFVKNRLLSAVLPTRPTVLREGVPAEKERLQQSRKRKYRDEEEMVLAKRVRGA